MGLLACRAQFEAHACAIGPECLFRREGCYPDNNERRNGRSSFSLPLRPGCYVVPVDDETALLQVWVNRGNIANDLPIGQSGWEIQPIHHVWLG
jgi:hypothetical protein